MRIELEWRSIETVPKDGTDFLAYVDGCTTICCWSKVSHVPLYGCVDLVSTDWDPENRDCCFPTHWMPLPDPPKEEEKGL